MSTHLRPACLLFVALYALAAVVPCPPIAAGERGILIDPAQHGATASAPDGHEDCHTAEPPALRAPCPCGCGERPAAAPGAARLGFALLAAVRTAPPTPALVPAPLPAALHAPAAPAFDLDPVPI